MPVELGSTKLHLMPLTPATDAPSATGAAVVATGGSSLPVGTAAALTDAQLELPLGWPGDDS